RWVDRSRKPKLILLFSTLWQIGGSSMYFMGISEWFVLGSRLVAGVGAGAESLILAEITRVTSEEERTGLISTMISMRQMGLLVGPGLNLFLRLANFNLGPFLIDKYTVPGAFMACVWFLQGFIILVLYTDLHKIKQMELKAAEEIQNYSPASKYETINGNLNSNDFDHNSIQQSEYKREIQRDTEKSVNDEDGVKAPKLTLKLLYNEYVREEVIVIFSVQFNSFFNQIALETMATPLSDKLLHWGEVENSIMYCLAGVQVILVFAVVRVLSRRLKDRTMMLFGAIVLTLANGWLMYIIPRASPDEPSENVPKFAVGIILDMVALPFLAVCSVSLYDCIILDEPSENVPKFAVGIILDMVALPFLAVCSVSLYDCIILDEPSENVPKFAVGIILDMVALPFLAVCSVSLYDCIILDEPSENVPKFAVGIILDMVALPFLAVCSVSLYDCIILDEPSENVPKFAVGIILDMVALPFLAVCSVSLYDCIILDEPSENVPKFAVGIILDMVALPFLAVCSVSLYDCIILDEPSENVPKFAVGIILDMVALPFLAVCSVSLYDCIILDEPSENVPKFAVGIILDMVALPFLAVCSVSLYDCIILDEPSENVPKFAVGIILDMVALPFLAVCSVSLYDCIILDEPSENVPKFAVGIILDMVALLFLAVCSVSLYDCIILDEPSENVPKFAVGIILDMVALPFLAVCSVSLYDCIILDEPSENVPKFAVGIILDMLALPFLAVCSVSLYSKITRKETQGLSQGIRRSIVGLSAILAPLWAGSTIDIPYVMFGVNIGLISMSVVSIIQYILHCQLYKQVYHSVIFISLTKFVQLCK
ncbi:hypothetical protein FSP39_019216, partial [Pinctada imbricata]